MPTMELLRERYDYHPDGFFIMKNPAKSSPYNAGDRLRGSITNTGRLQVTFLGKTYLYHRLIYIWHYGDIQYDIDHINNNPLDNRIENLRDITRGENNKNRIDTKQNGEFGISYKKRNRIPLSEEQKKTVSQYNREYYERKKINDN